MDMTMDPYDPLEPDGWEPTDRRLPLPKPVQPKQ